MGNALVKWLTLGVLILLSNVAVAETYTYTGVLYTTADSPYTTAMSINGSFTTAGPLPNSLPITPIGSAVPGLVTSWSFNDGVNTFNNTNSMEAYGNPITFSVGTDAVGDINASLSR